MKASVLMVTYNHGRFIRQAMESVLSQQTDFDYELIVGDDCSTDDTREIVRDYARKYPDRIRAVFWPENVGARRNFGQIYFDSRGEYAATLEGDDYWTCPHKLQRQVEFLETHRDCSMCFHSAMMVWEDGSHPPTPHHPPGRKALYGLEDALVRCFVHVSSKVTRNKLFDEFPDWYWRSPVGDWPFLVLHAMRGKIGYIDECWSVYRQHGGGVHSSLSTAARLEQRLGVVRIFREVMGPEYESVLRDAVHSRCLTLALHYQKAGDKTLARQYARMSIAESEPRWLPRCRNALKVLAYMHVPGLYRAVTRRRYRDLQDPSWSPDP